MRKYFIIFIILLMSIFGLSQDLRKTLVVYTTGNADDSAILRESIISRLNSQGKYRVVTSNDFLYRDVIEKISGNNTKALKDINADALIFVEILDTFEDKKYNEDTEQDYWEYNIWVNYKLIDINTAEVKETKRFMGSGTSYIDGFKSSFSANREARNYAISSVSSNIVTKLNALFKIKANVISDIIDDFVKVNLGRNAGIYEGMVFQFAREVNVGNGRKTILDGKLYVKQVREETAILRIAEYPTRFRVKDASYVLENPYMSPFRGRLNLYYTNFNSGKNGIGMKIGMDNYEGFYFAGDFSFTFASDQLDTLAGIEMGYMIYANNISVTPNIDLGGKTTFIVDELNGIYNSFYVSPGIMMNFALTKNIGFFAEGSYIFDFPIQNEFNSSTLDAENGLKINLGVEFIF
ncbi:MAG: hypothetical protein ACQESN_07310 [Thermotogota bacterium]